MLRRLDLVVLLVYVLGVVGLGSLFARGSGTPDRFMAAGRRLPGWVLGLSIFGTFLSSNTYLGVPGKAYAEDWSSFVFSLSLPFAAFVAARWFVPFYRSSGEISAYHHLERRFGRWARTYGMVCYLLTQLARVGSILFGVSLALHVLLGWSVAPLIVGLGLLVTLYTLLGGIEAVIWTDVVQSLMLTLGALLVVATVLSSVPGGLAEVLSRATGEGKTSLGSFAPDPTASTFWVVLLYGFFINLNNFGIDQSYVQRYHAAGSGGEAARSVWLAAWLYLPVSLLFFFIGTALFVFYRVHPGSLGGSVAADGVFPHFLVHELPPGVAGLVLAALLAAAMSSVDTSLNSSATVVLSDLYRTYVDPCPSERRSMTVLRLGTVAVGAAGTGIALAMIGVASLLDAWWTLSGVFAGGLLGLFLLGFLSRRASSPAAAMAVVAGVLVILWMTLSPGLEGDLAPFRSPLHTNLVIVVGTLTIFLVGVALSRLAPR